MTDTPASAADLVRMVLAFRVSRALHVVAILGVADLLGPGPRTSHDLALATGTDPAALYRLLRAVASVGVLREDRAGMFALTALGEYLRSDHPQSVHGLAVYQGHSTTWATWQDLLHSVTTGAPAFRHLYGVGDWEYREQDLGLGAIFDAAMAGNSRRDRDAVVAGYDFSGSRTVVDVGGGHGVLLAGILAANPQTRGILFDQPHVVIGAVDVLREEGVADRCTVIGGNFFDAVPEGGDVYLLKFIVHDWDDAQAVAILRACRRAMLPDARLVVAERVVAPSNAPDPAKYMDLTMLVMNGGRERTDDDFASLFEAAGFRPTRVIPTAAEFRLIEGIPI